MAIRPLTRRQAKLEMALAEQGGLKQWVKLQINSGESVEKMAEILSKKISMTISQHTLYSWIARWNKTAFIEENKNFTQGEQLNDIDAKMGVCGK